MIIRLTIRCDFCGIEHKIVITKKQGRLTVDCEENSCQLITHSIIESDG